ncbi:MAG: glycosyltransferase family 4 protein [Ilumatobacter sp.]|uniref:glycosyltransferase family 4 protein n=1 Tax=Ilumatobacter sp. TaxID=1967498 RepID=UPI002631C8EA|nr:glycosyltransferase family 4 protein [Ilumatobacter sp.]MDJ0769199.1 glycosyltransferase family 4 protein [Ilumatobacter sp.]
MTAATGTAPTPRRLLVVHSADEGYGSDRILTTVIDVLRDRGHHVEVALPDDSGPGWLSSTLRDRGIDVHVVDLGVVRRSSLRWPRIGRLLVAGLAAPVRVRRLMRRRGLDALYLNSLALMPLLFLPVVRRRNRWLHCHEILVSPRAFAIVERVAPRFVAHVFAVSHAVRRALGDAANVTVVHNGIAELPVRREPTATQVVAFVGRLSEWKGVDDFVEMAGAIDRDDVTFEIAGGAVPGDDSAGRAVVEACAGSGGRLRYLGELADTSELIGRSDILVVPSRRPDPYPTVVLEGMRAGCVVVATDGGGAAEAIRDGVDGFLVPMGDPNTLATVTTAVLDDPDLAARISAAAQTTFATQHSLAAFSERLASAFTQEGL